MTFKMDRIVKHRDNWAQFGMANPLFQKYHLHLMIPVVLPVIKYMINYTVAGMVDTTIMLHV